MSNSRKFDSEKAPINLVDPAFIESMARVMGIGEKKYGVMDWQGLKVERLLAAAERHILDIKKGIDRDEETNEPHAAHAASGLMFINWILANRPEQDDRRWAGRATVPVLRGDTGGCDCGGGVHAEPSTEVGLDLPEVHQASASEQASPRSYTQGTVADSQRLITAWADRTFPDRTIEEAVKKLKKETAELEVSGHLDAGEFADVAILLFDIAHLQGIDLSRAIENKMRINESRQWQKLKDGTHQHIAEVELKGPFVELTVGERALPNIDRAQLQSFGESRAPKTATINAGLPDQHTLVQCPQCGVWLDSYPLYTAHYKNFHGAKHAKS